MRPRTNFLIDVIALAAYVVATNPVTTGTPIHEWLSLGVAFVCFVHLVAHWDWTVHAAKRLLGKLGSMSRVNLTIDAALLVAMVSVMTSGLMVSRSVLAPLGHVVTQGSVWHAVHAESTTALLAVLGVHLGMHWPWIASTFRRQVLERLMRSATPAARPASRVAAERRTNGAKRLGGAAQLAGTLLASLAIIAATAGLVLTAVPAAREGLSGPTPAVASPQASGAVAAGFGGTTAERIAVRASHTLVVLVISVVAGAALRGALKPS